MNCDRFSQYIDDLVDGELDTTIKTECEEHIQSCTSCKQLYDNYMFMINSLNDFGDLDKSDIIFPSDLHSNIMSGVNKAIAESNIINILQSDTNSENIVNTKETSSDNIIDITKEINKDNKEIKTNNKRSFYKKYGNSLVAGFVSVFVATGAYQTYQYLNSPTVMQTPMLTIEAETSSEAPALFVEDAVLDTTTDSVAANSTPESQDSVLENIDPNITVSSEQSTTTNTDKKITEEKASTNNYGTNSVVPPDYTTAPNQDSVVTSNQKQSDDGKLSTPVEQKTTTTQSVQEPQPAVAPTPSPKSAKLMSSPQLKISVNSSDLEAYLDYLSTSPDFNITGFTKTVDGIQVNGSTQDFEKFVSFAKQYSDIENPNINIEYSEETLAKIKETGHFDFTIQQN